MIARWPVGYKAFDPESTDAMGIAVPAHTEPVTRHVFAIEDLASEEPVPGRKGSVLHKRLYCAPGDHVDSRDLFVIDGKDWKVFARDADWTRGPFGFEPGVVVTVYREEG